MHDQQQVLDHRQALGAPDVADVDERHHGEDEQGALPSGAVVAGVIDGDETLDDGAGEERARGGAGLPGES